MIKIDCTHPNTFHAHGTRNAYVVDRCRCPDCSAAAREYEQRRRRERLYGRAGNLVDADPVREHLRRLSTVGMGWKRVGQVAGVANGTMYSILYGRGGTNPAEHRPPRKRIRRDIAEQILAVEPDLAPGAPVPAIGTVRRLQALAAVGWSLTRLAPRLGMLPSNLHALVHGRDQVLRRTADQVTALYEELWNQTPPHTEHRDLIAYRRTLRYASERGWLPPAAWDDDALDDPAATPAGAEDADHAEDLDEVAIWRRIHGDRVPITRAERIEIVRRLIDTGMPKNEIERHTGINPYRLRVAIKEAS